MRVFARLEIPSAAAPSQKVETPEKEALETLRSDKSQATIANFFQMEEE
jgi:hypothetical protein